MIKITENMWCWNCDHEWKTDDYYACKECVNCKIVPVRIMRTSSIGFVYAWEEKYGRQRKRDEKIGKIID